MGSSPSHKDSYDDRSSLDNSTEASSLSSEPIVCEVYTPPTERKEREGKMLGDDVDAVLDTIIHKLRSKSRQKNKDTVAVIKINGRHSRMKSEPSANNCSSVRLHIMRSNCSSWSRDNDDDGQAPNLQRRRNSATEIVNESASNLQSRGQSNPGRIHDCNDPSRQRRKSRNHGRRFKEEDPENDPPADRKSRNVVESQPATDLKHRSKHHSKSKKKKRLKHQTGSSKSYLREDASDISSESYTCAERESKSELNAVHVDNSQDVKKDRTFSNIIEYECLDGTSEGQYQSNDIDPNHLSSYQYGTFENASYTSDVYNEEAYLDDVENREESYEDIEERKYIDSKQFDTDIYSHISPTEQAFAILQRHRLCRNNNALPNATETLKEEEVYDPVMDSSAIIAFRNGKGVSFDKNFIENWTLLDLDFAFNNSYNPFFINSASSDDEFVANQPVQKIKQMYINACGQAVSEVDELEAFGALIEAVSHSRIPPEDIDEVLQSDKTLTKLLQIHLSYERQRDRWTLKKVFKEARSRLENWKSRREFSKFMKE